MIMLDLFLLFGLASLLTWAVVDIYFYSIVFDPIRQYGEQWKEAPNYFWRCFRYMLACPFCLSHWIAAANLAAIIGVGAVNGLPVRLHPLLALLLIPAVARVSLSLKEWSLPPLTNIYETAPEEKAETPDQPKTIPGVSETTDGIHYTN